MEKGSQLPPLATPRQTPPLTADRVSSPFAAHVQQQLHMDATAATFNSVAADADIVVVPKTPRHAGFGRANSTCFQDLRDEHGINEVDIAELRTIKTLGAGAFATVELCLYSPKSGAPTQMVAVKKLKPNVVSHEADLASFMAEISLMRKLKHQHIVDYIGIGSAQTGSDAARRRSMFMVSELLEGGTLKRLVMKQMKTPHQRLYSHSDALRWCIHIGQALAYLHETKPTIIHRDLKLENILLKGTETCSQEAKLADFGLVAFVNKKNALQRRQTLTRTLSSRNNMLGVEEGWERNSRNYISKLATSNGARPPRVPPSSAASGGAAAQRVSGGTAAAAAAAAVLRHTVGSTATGPSRSSGEGANLKHGKAGSAEPKYNLSGRTGTYMYMAPEMFEGADYNEKVDVFSFGIIMYELFHKYMMVFAISIAGTEEELVHYAERVASGWRPPLCDSFPQEILDLIKATWAQEPQDRPSMPQVVSRLQAVQVAGLLDGMHVQQQGCACTIS